MDIARKTAIVCAVIVGFALALYCVYLARSVLLLLLIAGILAIAINPMIIRLERLGLKRTWGAAAALLLVLVVLFAVLATIVTLLAQQAVGLANNLPELTSALLKNPVIADVSNRFNITASLNELAGRASTIFLGSSSSFISIAGDVASTVTDIFIILVLTYLLHLEGRGMWERGLGFLSDAHAHRARRVADQVIRAVGGFVSGNLFISLIAGIVTLVTLLILRVPYAFALAALVALFDLIPMVGAAIATVAVGFVALTQGFLVAIIAVAVLLVYQFVEGHVLQPVIYSKSLDLSALLVVVASVLGAEIGGIVGILLAIPLAAVAQIVIHEAYSIFSKRTAKHT
jgi:predicted PurR-regulated permease PerM